MRRRELLTGTGLALTGPALGREFQGDIQSSMSATTDQIQSVDWLALRKLFPLTHEYIQLATFLLASHPRPVANAIDQHRRAFDENPADYWHANVETIDAKIAASAAAYMGGSGDQIALTDSTTMGLGLVYSGLILAPDDEVLQTTHDHYSTDLSLELRAQRTGAKVRKIALYDNPAQVSVDEVVARIRRSINRKTRAVVVTWVHSSTGVKLPLRAIADEIAVHNQKRSSTKQILFCVDGVHGFGVENQDVSQLGYDFFIAGVPINGFSVRAAPALFGAAILLGSAPRQ